MKKLILCSAAAILCTYVSQVQAHTTYIVEKHRPALVVEAPPPVVVVAAPVPEYTMVEAQPPVELVEECGVAPGPSYVWMKGHWQWEGRWVWVKGNWADRPHPAAVWVQGGWVSKHNHYLWVAGRWE